MAESGFNPNAVSPAGAQGIAQFMPGTAAGYGLNNPFDAEAAIDAQAHLMSDLLRQFRSIPLALAAYNAGPGAVGACHCIPLSPRPAPTSPASSPCSTAPASCWRRRSRCGSWIEARLRRMAAVEVVGIEGLKELMGKTIGPGEWRTVTQEDIDTFADLTGDHQWIHTDVERAKAESPFGTTIAHGNLTLSIIDGLRIELIESSGFKLGVNYGWNKVRFPAPVPAGARVRVDRRGGRGRRRRRRLVADRHPLHDRGRGLRQALLRRRLGRPRAA